MNKEQKTLLLNALMTFAIRATKEGATETEVKTLPEIARILIDISDRRDIAVVGYCQDSGADEDV